MELNNTYIETFKDDVKDRIETEVGDSKQPEFYPQLKIKRWDNEVNFSIRLREDSSSAVYGIVENKILYENTEKSTQFYPLENGHEFEVILKEQPKSNVIEFTIQSKGLDFFYQSELTEQEIADGCTRPENVVGSYAIYHSTKRNNNTKGKFYYTGKFCHIYRPKATDSKGIEIWCDLFIDIQNKVATITIPQKFLNKAVYPVTIDPEFGFHTKGASFSTFSANYQISCDFALIENGTANFLAMWCKKNDATAKQIQFGIYSGNTLVANTGSVDMPTDANGNWCPNNVIISGGTLIAGTLRLAFNHNAANPILWYDSTAINGGYQSKAFGSWTNPASWSVYNNLKWSIYCDYTAAITTTAVGDTSQFIFNVRKTVGDISQFVFNDLVKVGDTSQLIWDVKQKVGDTSQFVFNDRAVIGNTNDLLWNINSIVGDTSQLIFDTRKSVGDSSELKWNTYKLVGDTSQFIWNTLRYFATLYCPSGSNWIKENLKALDKTGNGFEWKNVRAYIPDGNEWKEVDISG